MEGKSQQDKYFLPFLLALLLGLTILARMNMFIQDDAFISFRYAANLAEGYGLVWNPGERVEGYTNFLWTLLMAAPHALGFGPVIFSQMIGLALFAGSLLLTCQIARTILHSRLAGLAAILLVGGNYTFSAYATGGLETQLQVFLITLGCLLCIRIQEQPGHPRYPWLFSLAAGLAVLTRLDSALPFGLLYLYLIFYEMRNAHTKRLNWKKELLPPLIIPAALLVIPWLVWKAAYYGSLLPNTFFVKAASPSGQIFLQGARYVSIFLNSYLLTPVLLIALLQIKKLSQVRYAGLPGILCLAWGLYVIFVGGDFMEFRFMVPVLPLLFIFILTVIWSLRPNSVKWALVALLLAASWRHAVVFENREGIESIASLDAHVTAQQENWMGAGQRLKDLFGDLHDIRIATTAAGAIPYYSRLYSLDMLGLNDAWVARNGLPIGNRPGHQRIAPLSYLLEKRVNLVIGQPMVLPRGIRPQDHAAFGELEIWSLMDVDSNQLADEPLMVEIPLDSIYTLSVVYLVRDAQIDRVIQEHELATYPIHK